MCLVTCHYCGKRFRRNSVHFELEETKRDLAEAIIETQALLKRKPYHADKKMFERGLSKYKRRLDVVNRNLREVEDE